MTLHPDSGQTGTLRIAIRGNEVIIDGKNCIFRTSPAGSLDDKETSEKLILETHISLALQNVQITWKHQEAQS